MKKTDIVNWKVPFPFAFGSDSHLYRMGTEASGLTYPRGFSQVFSSEAGQKVALGDVNGMFNMATAAAYFSQRGGWRTFSKEVSAAIGGYPEGAILYWYDQNNGKLRTVRSMKGDNEDDFNENPDLIDGSSWAFVDEIPAASFRVRMFAGKTRAIGSASTSSPWTAPFDCVAIAGGAAVVRGTTDNAYSVFIQVKNAEDEGFGTAGILGSYISPDMSARSYWYNSQEAYGDIGIQHVPAISDFGAVAVVYVSKGGILMPMASDGRSVSIQFTYCPLEF